MCTLPHPCLGDTVGARGKEGSYCKPGYARFISNSVWLMDVGAAGGGGGVFQGYKTVPNTSYCSARRKTQH